MNRWRSSRLWQCWGHVRWVKPPWLAGLAQADAIFLDMERPADIAKVHDAETYLASKPLHQLQAGGMGMPHRNGLRRVYFARGVARDEAAQLSSA